MTTLQILTLTLFLFSFTYSFRKVLGVEDEYVVLTHRVLTAEDLVRAPVRAQDERFGSE